MSDLDFDFDPEMIDKPLRLRERALVELILILIVIVAPMRWKQDRTKVVDAIRNALRAK